MANLAKLSDPGGFFQTILLKYNAKLVNIRDNRELYCLQVSGKKKVTHVFVHGSCARMSQFRFLVADSISKGYGVVAYDVYGCGASYHEEEQKYEAYATSELLEDQRTIIKNLVPKGDDIVLISHSFGTSQTLRFLSNPSVELRRIKAVIQLGSALHVDTPGLFNMPLFFLQLIHPLLTFAFNYMSGKGKEIDENNVDQTAAKHAKELQVERDACAGKNPMHMCQAFYCQFEWIPEDMLKQLNTSNEFHDIPILFLSGKNDNLTPPHEAFEKFPTYFSNWKNIQLALIEDAGHQVMLDQPKKCIELITTFLSN